MEKRKGDWCQTFTGRAIYPLDMRPGDVDILDIAHSLALQCRFTGHCRVPYSVGEHSLRVCWELSDENLNVRRWGLLHDAAEAYMQDIPRPVKRSITGWQEIEVQIESCIAKRFNLPLPIPSEVRNMDSVLLATEARDIMAPPPQSWGYLPDPLLRTIRPMSWRVVERQFLREAKNLRLACR